MTLRIAALSLILAVLTACAGQTLHRPTTAGNAGTSALIAYAISGATAGKYFALPLCATPPIYPCKTQALNDRLALADTAAYNAAKAADAAANNPLLQYNASDKLDSLKAVLGQPDVKTQIQGGN